MKRTASYIVVIAATVLLTSTFQPLSFLPTFASPSHQTDCQTFKETGKTVCGKFLAYWKEHGGLPQQGFPISNEFNEKSDLNGQTYRVQYFERAVFELHPENQPPYDVLLSQLGTFWARQKYGNPPQFPGEGAPPPPPPPPGLNVPVSLRDGVTITLVPSGGGYDSGPQANRCFGTMVWAFRLDNTANSAYSINIDKASLSMTDDTGMQYPAESRCIGAPFLGDFPGPTTLAAQRVAYGAVMFNPTDLPTGARYLDMRMTLSGTVLTFRYPLR